jgi:hypothetical protein
MSFLMETLRTPYVMHGTHIQDVPADDGLANLILEHFVSDGLAIHDLGRV